MQAEEIMSEWIDLKNSDPTIHYDQEYDSAARITIEKTRWNFLRRRPKFELTCGLYGRMVHTRYFSTISEAKAEAELMKLELARIAEFVIAAGGAVNSPERELVHKELWQFVERFPT